jgi:pterin-4a-carbinolamine dehydratase
VHHRDILLSWGKAEITTWTHKIDGSPKAISFSQQKIDKLK